MIIITPTMTMSNIKWSRATKIREIGQCTVVFTKNTLRLIIYISHVQRPIINPTDTGLLRWGTLETRGDCQEKKKFHECILTLQVYKLDIQIVNPGMNTAQNW